jgi:uncharacterized protein
MRNPVGWFEIYVSDIDRAKKFYEQTFGIKLEKLPPLKNNETNPEFDPSKFEMWTFPMEMNAGGAGGAIVKWMVSNPAAIAYWSILAAMIAA